eukprot:scaffold138644_cov26-Tisochrysis_lutea.AAC.4
MQLRGDVARHGQPPQWARAVGDVAVRMSPRLPSGVATERSCGQEHLKAALVVLESVGGELLVHLSKGLVVGHRRTLSRLNRLELTDEFLLSHAAAHAPIEEGA